MRGIRGQYFLLEGRAVFVENDGICSVYDAARIIVALLLRMADLQDVLKPTYSDTARSLAYSLALGR